MLSDPVIWLAGLIEIDLPSKTVRLCDGAWVDWPGRGRFDSFDEDFGAIASVSAVTESIGDEAASATLTLFPPSITAAGALLQPTAQGRAIRGWDAEYDPATNMVRGTPSQLFEGLIDTLTIVNDQSGRSFEIEFFDAAQKLWMIKEGNVLSPRWHKSIWPGETGLDHATGSPISVPWGITGPARGSIFVGSGAGGGGGGLSLVGAIHPF